MQDKPNKTHEKCNIRFLEPNVLKEVFVLLN